MIDNTTEALNEFPGLSASTGRQLTMLSEFLWLITEARWEEQAKIEAIPEERWVLCEEDEEGRIKPLKPVSWIGEEASRIYGCRGMMLVASSALQYAFNPDSKHCIRDRIAMAELNHLWDGIGTWQA